MAILLAGDIGGTKTILRLVSSESSATAGQLPVQTTLFEQIYVSRDYPDLVPIVRRFIDAATDRVGESIQVMQACFGIAGPVVNNASKLTNLSWSLEAERLEKELAIQKVRLINDFAAVGYGVLGLTQTDIEVLQKGKADASAPIAIIGAGTGLGEGFLIPTLNGYQVFPSEGGHADFAPRNEIEFDLQRYLLERFHIDRLSVERVVSGMGIHSIYQFFRDRDLSKESPALTEAYSIWQREMGHEHKTVDLAAVISQAALNQTDILCQETMKLFVKAYGAEAGNLALKLLPYGGLYIAGGIASKILPLMKEYGFLYAFLQKGRVSPLLEDIPVRIVLNPKVGLIGAALYAAL